MGLDIRAYSKIKLLENVHLDEGGDPIDVDGEPLAYFKPRINKNYPNHAEGIEDGAFYGYEKEFVFCAGGCIGYNEWRNKLARLVGYKSAEEVWNKPEQKGPFVELINFSDCEGVIGSSLSAKLAKDFADFDDRAKFFAPKYGFYSLYQKLQKAFELASQNGAVEFTSALED